MGNAICSRLTFFNDEKLGNSCLNHIFFIAYTYTHVFSLTVDNQRNEQYVENIKKFLWEFLEFKICESTINHYICSMVYIPYFYFRQ